MASGVISNAQISASSQMDDKHAAQYGRLKKAGAWVARKIDLHQWLQVDLGSYITVTRVATQGRNEHDQWVKKYKIQYSVDGVIFQVYKESGNDSAKVHVVTTVVIISEKLRWLINRKGNINPQAPIIFHDMIREMFHVGSISSFKLILKWGEFCKIESDLRTKFISEGVTNQV